MTSRHPVPEDALSAHVAIVGKTGSGKTYSAKGIVEHLLRAQRRVCIVDPTGAWWGLRSSADGKHAGFPVAVFGGEHADVPIVAGSGAALAEIVAKQNVPAVIDVSEFLIGERHRFMEDFAATLYRENRTPLHLIIDEADDFAPQNPLPESKRMLHRVDQIVRRGRIRGFRVMLITQRPAVINKNVLTQANTLIAMRLVSPQDRKAIEDWIKGQADVAQGREVLNTLARLQRGEGWIWSPEHDVLQRVQFPKISTFDSSRTPEDGEAIEAPARLADVDLDAIKGSLAAAEEEAKANDPKALKARIAELERQAAKGAASSVDPAVLTAEHERGKVEGLRLSGLGFDSLRSAIAEARGAVTAALDEIDHGLNTWQVQHGRAVSDATPVDRSTVSQTRPIDEMRNSQVRAPAPRAPSASTRPAPHQRVLNGIAWLESAGISPASRIQAGLAAGYSASSSNFSNILSALRTGGRIDYPREGFVALTDAGRAEAERPRERVTTAALHATLERLLPAPRWRVLKVAIDAYPSALTREQLAQQAGYSSDSSNFSNIVSAIRTAGFIDYPAPGQVVALPVLFLGG